MTILFINNLFPSRLSGRTIAPVALRHFTGIGWDQAVAATVAHTGIYAILYGIVTFIGWGVSADVYGSGLTAIILFSTSIYLIVGVGVIIAGWRLDVFNYVINRITQSVRALPSGRRIATALNNFQSKLIDGANKQFRLLVRDPQTVSLFALTWILGVMILPAFRVEILLSATGAPEVNTLLLPLYIIVAYSVTILPITPGGIGVAEATGIAVFIALGVPESAIAAVVFLDRLFGVYLPSLFGWFPIVRTELRTTAE